MNGTRPGLVACDGARIYVRESDWPLVRPLLANRRPAAVVAAEAIRRAKAGA